MPFRPKHIFMPILIGVALLFSVVALPPTAVHAATYFVTTITDSFDGTCDADCSLRDAVAAANATADDEAIIFNVSGTIDLTANGTLTINSAGTAGTLTIDGSDNITLSNTASRHFLVNSGGDLTLQHLTLVGGGTGGGILNSGGALTITVSTLSNNVASSDNYGGGVYVTYGTLFIGRSTFTGNTAENAGGGVSSFHSTVTITNSTFSGNSSAIGGGIAHYAGTVTITNSTFSGNSATYIDGNGGGGEFQSGTITITNSTFSGNAAPNGGGIYVLGDNVTLNNTIIANSTNGGDCLLAGGTINASHSLIEDGLGCVNGTNTNNLTGDPGLGALTGDPAYFPITYTSPAYDAGFDLLVPSDIPYDQAGNPRFNGTVDMGSVEATDVPPVLPEVSILGPIGSVAEGGSGDFTISRSGDTTDPLVVNINIALGSSTTTGDYTLSGGSISAQEGAATVTIPAGESSVAVTFAAWDDVPAEPDNTLTIELTSDAAYSLGVPNSGSATIPANDFVVTTTTATGEGSLTQAITNAQATTDAETITFTVSGTISLSSTFTINDAATAGALTIDGSGQAITLSRTANRHFVVGNGGNLSLNALTIDGGGTGGGVENYHTVAITNSTFSGNSATGNGGGVWNGNTLTITNSTFSGNSATGNGGGVYNGNTLTIINSTFSGNSATFGGGVYSYLGTVTLNNTILANSTSIGDCYRGTYAGPINASYSLIEGGLGCVNGTNDNNLTSDPDLGTLTGSPAYFPLNTGSIAINAGSDALVPVGVTTDQAGNPRFNGTVDMGSVEATDVPPVLPEVSILGPIGAVAEGGSGDFTISRSGDTTDPLVVNINIALGSSTTTGDYTLSGGSISAQEGAATVTIPAGESSVAVTFAAWDDVPAEPDNTLTIELTSDAAYSLGVPNSGSATIPANDLLVTSLDDSAGGGGEGGGGEALVEFAMGSPEGTLRQAVLNANTFPTDDTITFAVSGTIMLIGGALYIDDTASAGTLTIDGSGQSVTISSPADRHFSVSSGGNLALNALALDGSSTGGGIDNYGGILTVTNSTISNNWVTGYGGGINNHGTLTVINSTFSGNVTMNNGGGIHNNGGTATITNSTFSGNTANNGGGIYTGIGTSNLYNSIFANSSGGDCVWGSSGTVNANHSLIEDGLTCVNGTNDSNLTGDPGLGALTGSPAYFPITSSSAAYNAGSDALVPVGVTTDQAGNPRFSGTVDMGAYEVPVPTSAEVVSITRDSVSPTNAASVSWTVTFNTPVTGVSISNFTLAVSSSAGQITGVTGSGTTYTVTASTGTIGRPLTLRLYNATGITPTLVTPLPFLGETYLVDHGEPRLTIASTVSSPTTLTTIPVTVTFNESVTGFDATDLVIGNGISLNFAGSGRNYTFDLIPAGSGTVTVDVAAGAAQDAVGNLSQAAAQFSITVNSTPVSVVSFTRDSSSPTNVSSVSWTITFSGIITGLSESNFALLQTASLSGSVITGVTGSGATYTVTASTGTGSGILTPRLANATGIAPGVTTTLPYAGSSYFLDRSIPRPAITSATSSTTSSNPIPITVTFSEPIINFDETDLVIGNGAATNFVTVTAGRTYTFDLVPTAVGTVTVNIPANAAQDTTGNLSQAAIPFSRSYILPPTVSVTITRANADPTNAASVAWTVTFSDTVTGVSQSNFDLIESGISGASITNVTGSGTTYTVTASTGTGTGALTLRLANAAGLTPGVSNALPFMGPAYTLDLTAPTVMITSPIIDPTTLTLIPVMVTFSENVAGFDVTDLVISNGAATNFAGSGSTYTFDLIPTASGVVTVNILPGAAQDAVTNSSTAAAEYSITYNMLPVAVTSLVRLDANPTNSGSLRWQVTFAGAVSGLSASNFDVVQVSGVSGATVSDVSGYGTTWIITVNSGSGSGFLTLRLANATGIVPGVTNPLPYTGQTYSIDRSLPNVTITSATGNPTSANPIPITITFGEAVTGFDVTDLVLLNSTAQNFTTVTPGRVFTVAIIPTAAGVVQVSIPAGVAQDAVGNFNPARSFIRNYAP